MRRGSSLQCLKLLLRRRRQMGEGHLHSPQLLLWRRQKLIGDSYLHNPKPLLRRRRLLRRRKQRVNSYSGCRLLLQLWEGRLLLRQDLRGNSYSGRRSLLLIDCLMLRLNLRNRNGGWEWGDIKRRPGRIQAE